MYSLIQQNIYCNTRGPQMNMATSLRRSLFKGFPEVWGSTQQAPRSPSFILKGYPSLGMFFGDLSVASCGMTNNTTPREMVSVDPSSPFVTWLLPQITNLLGRLWCYHEGLPESCLAPRDYVFVISSLKQLEILLLCSVLSKLLNLLLVRLRTHRYKSQHTHIFAQ